MEAAPVSPPRERPEERRSFVILAEDDEDLRYILENVLGRAGFHVVAVGDGRGAVEAYQAARERVDAIVLDMTMPVMDGAAALRALRAIDPGVPVLICSSLHPEEVRRRTTEARPTAILTKPMRLDTLVETLQSAMAGREPERDARRLEATRAMAIEGPCRV